MRQSWESIAETHREKIKKGIVINGRSYESIREASDKIGVAHSTIRRLYNEALKSNRSSITGSVMIKTNLEVSIPRP